MYTVLCYCVAEIFLLISFLKIFLHYKQIVLNALLANTFVCVSIIFNGYMYRTHQNICKEIAKYWIWLNSSIWNSNCVFSAILFVFLVYAHTHS